VLLVLLSCQEILKLLEIAGSDDHDPPPLMRRLIDQLRVGFELSIDFDDLPAERGIDGGDGLDRLDRGELLHLFDFGADLGQLDVDDVAQFVLGVMGDADASLAVFEV
jgi:hypothetical protein